MVHIVEKGKALRHYDGQQQGQKQNKDTERKIAKTRIKKKSGLIEYI